MGVNNANRVWGSIKKDNGRKACNAGRVGKAGRNIENECWIYYI